jgi:hypothetical protein
MVFYYLLTLALYGGVRVGRGAATIITIVGRRDYSFDHPTSDRAHGKQADATPF